MAAKLTVIIPCKNERDNISPCVVSALQVADEVLVADSGSTDGTLKIALELGCRIIEREYGTSGDFKNWAIPQAAQEWVLILDADERISPALAAEIRTVLSGPSCDGYWIHRLNHFMGHPIYYGPWKNDSLLRLFKRDVGRYVGPTDHAEVRMPDHPVGRLHEPLIHYSCNSYSQYLPKVERYASVQARVWQAQGRQPKLLQLLFRFPVRFLQGYIGRLGFLDGMAGLQICMLVAYVSWLKQAYLWQLQRGRDWRAADREQFAVSKTATQPAEDKTSTDSDIQLATPLPVEPPLASRRRTFREARRRLTPAWLSSDVRRHRRNQLFRKLGIQRCYAPPIIVSKPFLAVRSCLPFVVSHELLRNPKLTFLQIGAFDGVGEDDLREIIVAHKLRGILVEPQAAAFARLKNTYRHQPNVTLLEAAIAEEAGVRDLYFKRGEASMAASFDRNHLLKHDIAETEIVSQQVICHTVESALQTAGLSQVDILQIDAEGYDWPIIRSINFERVKPSILRFEYRIMPPQDANACLEFLASHG
ncbi:MAG TPA: FkbM family methyltransferase, partial [Lacipirellulaceae bacterium]|nr:FkbM family methyltransferase [Lacipirellulaceae bacterium]